MKTKTESIFDKRFIQLLLALLIMEEKLAGIKQLLLECDDDEMLHYIALLKGCVASLNLEYQKRVIKRAFSSEEKVQENFLKVIEADIPISASERKPIEVQTLAEVPNSRAYWVKDTQEWAVRINGKVIRGIPATITRSKAGTIPGLMACKYGADCHSLIETGECRYWHPRSEIITLTSRSPPDEEFISVGAWFKMNCLDKGKPRGELENRQNSRLLAHMLFSELKLDRNS